MSTTSFQTKNYWIKTPDGVLSNNKIGTFEFLTEANARTYIKEEKLKNAKVLLVYRNITESITVL